MGEVGPRPPLRALALGALGVLVAVGFPIAAAEVLGVHGARAFGAVVLAAGLASWAWSLRHRLPGVGAGLRALPLALPALAVLTGAALFLQLVPAAIEAGLCVVFLGSLRGGGSLLQEAARTIEPHAPDFIAPYCRKATAAFAALFAVQAVVLAGMALGPADPVWARRASLVVWGPTVVGVVVEFLVRKIHFRNYRGGPVDRVLRALFPPENTPQGRRSLEYVRRMRRELGMPPP